MNNITGSRSGVASHKVMGGGDRPAPTKCMKLFMNVAQRLMTQ